MDWKFEAAEKLRQYEARRQALESIPEEIRRLGVDFVSIRSGLSDPTPVRGGGSRREDAMINNIALRDELARQLDSAKSWVSLVDAGLACLDQEERQVLDRFYIHRQHGHVERLCDELCVERKAVYSKKDKALKKFTLALYGDVGG